MRCFSWSLLGLGTSLLEYLLQGQAVRLKRGNQILLRKLGPVQVLKSERKHLFGQSTKPRSRSFEAAWLGGSYRERIALKCMNQLLTLTKTVPDLKLRLVDSMLLLALCDLILWASLPAPLPRSYEAGSHASYMW